LSLFSTSSLFYFEIWNGEYQTKTLWHARSEVRYLSRGSVFSGDTINCSNLASNNRRIHSRVRNVLVRWEDTLHTEHLLYQLLSELLISSRTKLCSHRQVSLRFFTDLNNFLRSWRNLILNWLISGCTSYRSSKSNIFI